MTNNSYFKYNFPKINGKNSTNYFNTYANMADIVMNKLYGYFVKYDRLTPLINSTFRNSDASVLDIFIDCNDIFNHVGVKDENASFIDRKNKLYITSGIVNMCAHYRNFFRKYYSTTTRFWLLYSHNVLFHNQQFSQYDRDDINISEIISENIAALESLCPYLPDIMWCDSVDGFENALVMKQILDFERNIVHNNNPAILISKDPYNYLIPAEIPNTYILRPKKYNGEDLSYIVDFNTCLYAYVNDVYNKTLSPALGGVTVDPDRLGILMALGKVPTRNLNVICRIDTILNILMSSGYGYHIYDIKTFLDQIPLPPKVNRYEVTCRYCALDILYSAIAYNEAPKKFIYTGMVNLYDSETVKRINETYFRYIPLDLEVL